jgi:imidazole glycerol-phosphate synthase subunit HisF
MKRARIIPVLLLKEQGLVKTIKFDKERYIGDPLNAVKIFNAKQCDELVVLDILASKHKRPVNLKIIREIATECFMPLAYGGGISNLIEIEEILKSGVEKIILNSVLLSDPGFLKKAVKEFGSSTIVASVDVKKNMFGKYQVASHTGMKVRESNLFKYLSEISENEAGELMINVIDLDGTCKGYEMKLAKSVSEYMTIPVVWSGGCSGFEDMKALIEETQVSAAAAGSYFIYRGPLQAVLINYPESKEISNIKV